MNGHINMTFLYEAWFDDLVQFFMDKLNSDSFKALVIEIYSSEMRAAYQTSEVGAEWWMTSSVANAHDWTLARNAVIENNVLKITVGIPPQDSYFWERQTDGDKYWPLVLEYGIGSAGLEYINRSAPGRKGGTALRYHKIGEKTWAPTFEYTKPVTERNVVKSRGVPGELMPDDMNQKGPGFFDNVVKRVQTEFSIKAVFWWNEFVNRHPVKNYIMFT